MASDGSGGAGAMMEIPLNITSQAHTRSDNRQVRSAPDYIWSLVISEAIESWNLKNCFRLRLVNSYFNREFLREVFDLFKINRLLSKYGMAWAGMDEISVSRYWAAFISCKDPIRSLMLNSRHRPPELDIDRFRPYVTGQIKRLETIHSSLNLAVDVLCSLDANNLHQGSGVRNTVTSAGCANNQTALNLILVEPRGAVKTSACTAIQTDESGGVLSPKRQKSIRNHYVNAICNTAVCLFGSRSAWRFLHHEPRTSASDLYRAGAGGYSKELLCSQALSTKDAYFWVTLASAYVGNHDCLRTHLEPVRVQHSDVRQWLDRMTTTYYEFRQESSLAEIHWIDLLSACLTISVRRGDEKMTCFLLSQDSVVSTEMFQSLNFNEDLLTSLAVRSCSIVILNALLEYGWLRESTNWAFKARYETAIMEAANLDQHCPNRDATVVWLLTISVQWYTVKCFRMLLVNAVQRNDLRLIEIVVNMIGKDNDVRGIGADEWTASRTSAREDRCPLSVAACLGHEQIVRYLLIHAKELLLAETMKARRSPCNFKTAAIEAMMLRDASPDLTILAELLDQSKDLRLEQVQVLIQDPAMSAGQLDRFLQYVDIHGPASPGDDITLGERALVMAVFEIRIEIVKSLIETHKVRVTRPITLISRRGARKFIYGKSSTRDEVRTYLTDHEISFNTDWTVIWPSHLKITTP